MALAKEKAVEPPQEAKEEMQLQVVLARVRAVLLSLVVEIIVQVVPARVRAVELLHQEVAMLQQVAVGRVKALPLLLEKDKLQEPGKEQVLAKLQVETVEMQQLVDQDQALDRLQVMEMDLLVDKAVEQDQVKHPLVVELHQLQVKAPVAVQHQHQVMDKQVDLAPEVVLDQQAPVGALPQVVVVPQVILTLNSRIALQAI